LFYYLALRVAPIRLGNDMVVIDCTLMYTYMHEEDKGSYERAYRVPRWVGNKGGTKKISEIREP
jgi:hypothetical protein